MKKVLLLLSLFVLLVTPRLLVSAQESVNVLPPGTSVFTQLPNYLPSHVIAAVINILLGVAGIISFIFLLWGGIAWITAGGDKEGVEKSRKRVIAALLGLAVVFSAYGLLYIVRVLFDVDYISVDLMDLRNYATFTRPTPTQPPPAPTGGVITTAPTPPPAGITSIPTSTPAPPGANGTCYCDLSVVLTNNCLSPAVPQCSGQFSCSCVLPAGGANTPPSPTPTTGQPVLPPSPTSTPSPTSPPPTITVAPTSSPVPTAIPCAGIGQSCSSVNCCSGLSCNLGNFTCYVINPSPTPTPTPNGQANLNCPCGSGRYGVTWQNYSFAPYCYLCTIDGWYFTSTDPNDCPTPSSACVPYP